MIFKILLFSLFLSFFAHAHEINMEDKNIEQIVLIKYKSICNFDFFLAKKNQLLN